MRDKKTLMLMFGKVIRELRIERGLSQETLADLAQLTDRSHVSAIERGEKGPGINTVFALAEAFNVSASHIISLVELELKSSDELE